MSACFIGIDVGTGSARAGIFDTGGRMLSSAVRPIAMNKPKHDFVEQSSTDIWAAIIAAVRKAMADARLAPSDIKGIGFDATCSLVVLDREGAPVTVSPSGDPQWNIIVWMDHRAIGEAAEINAGGYDVLRYVGDCISPEMQSPKLLWLKRNMPATWSRAAFFFDLPDFLVWKATDADVRSLCSTVCKWTYIGHEGPNGHWDEAYWKAIGLGDLADDNWRRIGGNVRPMGEPAGKGLTARAAAELGLTPGTPVGVSIIDAHAGGIGVIGTKLDGEPLSKANSSSRMALIGGTSSCHMAVAPEARFVKGIWGPYYSAMVPGYWLNEGGQSATGALVDHVIHSHSASAEAARAADQRGITIYEVLNAELDAMARAANRPMAELTADLHVLPYFHGNRSPRADPTLRGMISGLRLSSGLPDLALIYLATIQAIAYGTRHIIEDLNAHGYEIKTICACGGGTKNPVYLQEHASVTGCRIVLSREPEAVLLGSAILGAVAARAFPSIEAAMAAMSGAGRLIEPGPSAVQAFHNRKYSVFKRMYDDHLAYRALMAN